MEADSASDCLENSASGSLAIAKTAVVAASARTNGRGAGAKTAVTNGLYAGYTNSQYAGYICQPEKEFLSLFFSLSLSLFLSLSLSISLILALSLSLSVSLCLLSLSFYFPLS